MAAIQRLVAVPALSRTLMFKISGKLSNKHSPFRPLSSPMVELEKLLLLLLLLPLPVSLGHE